MPAPLVFFDIAGPDGSALRNFYATVFDWEFGADGKTTVAATASIEAAVREDPAEKRLYLGVDDVAAALAAVAAAGGSIDVDRFEVPGVVVLGLFRDPAGNPMGLVEMAGATPKIP